MCWAGVAEPGTARAALIWCPFPDDAAALAATDALLEEGLIACGNVMPAMISRFVWHGTKHSARETGALLKTTAAHLDAAVARLAEIHPYDAPAIVGWICDAASSDTLAWLGTIGPPRA